jgi:hypothetical protein
MRANRRRAVLDGWDTLNVPTYRPRASPPYQGGRTFDSELRDQLELLPQFVIACGAALHRSANDAYSE